MMHDCPECKLSAASLILDSHVSRGPRKRQTENQQPNAERHFEDRGPGDEKKKKNQSLNSSGKKC